MKKIFKIWTLALIAVTMFTACQHDDELVVSQPITELSASADSNVVVSDSTTVNGPVKAKAATSLTEYEVSPKFGRPNSTKYSFKVYDLSGKLSISVKLYDKSTGSTKYYSMTRVGNYWTLSMKISSNGWYDWRYVYSVSKSNISSKAYTLCNTYNTFSSSGISSITWPFGADGSSWGYRNGWISGIEDGKGIGGYGWLEGTHTKTYNDEYAVDWNKGPKTNTDFGAELRSPLDGTIIDYGTYQTSLGSSKFVSVEQISANGTVYKFFFGHMNEIDNSLYVGKWVKAGTTRFGTLGMTGASSPHAHCSARKKSTNTSIKFEFDAK